MLYVTTLRNYKHFSCWSVAFRSKVQNKDKICYAHELRNINNINLIVLLFLWIHLFYIIFIQCIKFTSCLICNDLYRERAYIGFIQPAALSHSCYMNKNIAYTLNIKQSSGNSIQDYISILPAGLQFSGHKKAIGDRRSTHILLAHVSIKLYHTCMHVFMRTV